MPRPRQARAGFSPAALAVALLHDPYHLCLDNYMPIPHNNPYCVHVVDYNRSTRRGCGMRIFHSDRKKWRPRCLLDHFGYLPILVCSGSTRCLLLPLHAQKAIRTHNMASISRGGAFSAGAPENSARTGIVACGYTGAKLMACKAAVIASHSVGVVNLNL